MKKIVAGAVIAAGIGASIAGAGTASAASGYYAATYVNWGGSQCIGVNEAYGDYETFCGYGGAWELHERVYSGQDFGIDPIMGNADWITCSVYINTQLVYTDAAVAGDGTDVNCLRNKL